MFVRAVSLVVLLGLLVTMGCSTGEVLAPNEQTAPDSIEDPVDPGYLACAEPKQEAKSWGELKRQYAGREEKDN